MVDFWFFLIFLLYPSVGSLLFSTFACTAFDDGSSYLLVDRSLDCETEEHAYARLYAICIGAVYVLGIPTLYFAAIWRFRMQLGGVAQVEQFLLTSKQVLLSSAIDKVATPADQAREEGGRRGEGLSGREMVKRGIEPSSWRLHQKLARMAKAKLSSGKKTRLMRSARHDERNSGQPLLAARARAVALFKVNYHGYSLHVDGGRVSWLATSGR